MLFFLKNDTITEILNLKNYFYFPLRGVSLIPSSQSPQTLTACIPCMESIPEPQLCFLRCLFCSFSNTCIPLCDTCHPYLLYKRCKTCPSQTKSLCFQCFRWRLSLRYLSPRSLILRSFPPARYFAPFLSVRRFQPDKIYFRKALEGEHS